MADNINMLLERNEESSVINNVSSVAELILPPLLQQDGVGDVQASLNETSLAFSGIKSSTHDDDLHRTSEEQSCQVDQSPSTMNTRVNSTTATSSLASKHVDSAPEEMHATGNKVPEQVCNEEEPDSEKASQLKKRRGGWPKGKKRKKDCMDFNKPKSPIAGYVRFINSRRADVKTQYPNLPSLQITKIIGAEWNAMSTEEKLVYHDEAEDDKKRYLEELVAYQQTEAYRQFLKRRQTKKLKDIGVENLEGLDTSFLTENFDEVQGEDDSILFCKLCNRHFSSEHNKKEHLLGRQHLQMVTNDFEKDTTVKLNNPDQLESIVIEKPQHEGESSSTEMSEPTKLNTLSDVMETLLQHNYDREMEIRELRKTLSNSENRRMLLCKELDVFKKLILETEESLNARKLLGSTLTSQLDDLRVVPSLFGVML